MIKSVRLERFKNFRDATLMLGPLTVIVGTNASGKSNLRDAFRFLHGMSRGYSLAEIIGEKYVEGGVLQWKGIRGGTREVAFHGESEFALETTVSIPVDREKSDEANLKEWNGVHRISVALDDSRLGPRISNEQFLGLGVEYFDTGSFAKDRRARGEPEYLSVPLPFKETKRVGKIVRFLSTVPIVSQLRNNKVASVWNREPADRFLEQLRSMRFLDLSPDAMRMPSYPGQTVLGDRGENLSSVLQAICNDPDLKHALSEWVRELTPIDVVDFDFVADQTGRILVSLVESNGQRTSAYSASDGTLRFLAIIAALMGPDSAKFYFLEEIDNGIHPTRLSLLLQLIEQHTRQGKVQIVATTHSPQVLAMLSDEAREDAVLVYRLEHQAEAHIQRIMEIPAVRDVLQQQNLSRLHESGWLENVMAYTQPEEVEA